MPAALFGRRWSLAATLVVALAAAATGFATTVAIGFSGSRVYDRPAVIVLGSGNNLSVLVTDGPARLLLAAGDDSAAFGNALAKTRPLGRDRIDVLLLAGTTNDVTFLSRARRTAEGRHVEALGNPELIGALGLPADALLLSPRRFQLTRETHVTVETVDRSETAEGPSFAWRATIDHGTTRLLVLSDGRAVGDFASVGPVSALLVGGEHAVESLSQVDTQVLVVSAVALAGKEVRGEVAEFARSRKYVVRVFAGDATSFAFTDGGLELPARAVSVGGTPEPAVGSR
jgi:hypothetical protein